MMWVRGLPSYFRGKAIDPKWHVATEQTRAYYRSACDRNIDTILGLSGKRRTPPPKPQRCVHCDAHTRAPESRSHEDDEK